MNKIGGVLLDSKPLESHIYLKFLNSCRQPLVRARMFVCVCVCDRGSAISVPWRSCTIEKKVLMYVDKEQEHNINEFRLPWQQNRLVFLRIIYLFCKPKSHILKFK